MTAPTQTKRRRWPKIALAIYVVWTALTVGELWPVQHIFDMPPEYRFGIFIKTGFDGPRADISPREAHLLWVIRDPEPADGTLDVFSRNFGTMMRRASPLELPVVIPLDFLMLPFGESFALIRLIAVTAAGIILAAAAYLVVPKIAAFLWPRLRKSSPRLLIAGSIFSCVCSLCSLSVLGPLLCYRIHTVDIASGINAYHDRYVAGEPVITVFSGDSRFAHFAATKVLRLDNRIDLGQREFSADELEALIATLDADRIWVIFERGAPHLRRNFLAALDAIASSDRGIDFVADSAPVSRVPMSDDWHIRSHDVKSDAIWYTLSDIPNCWS